MVIKDHKIILKCLLTNIYACRHVFNQITTSLTIVIIKAPLYYGVDDLQRLKSIKIYFKLYYSPNRNISAFLCTGKCIAYGYGMWCHSLIPGGPLRSHAQSSNVRINQQLTFTREIKSGFLGFQTWCIALADKYLYFMVCLFLEISFARPIDLEWHWFSRPTTVCSC